MKSRRSLVLFLILLGVLAISLLISLSVGASGFISLGNILSTFFKPTSETAAEVNVLVMQIRLPRVLLGVFAGVNLALSGLIMQTLFRNPLADPYIMGISSGAALGAVSAITLGVNLSYFGLSAVTLCSFLSALSLSVLIYIIGKRVKSASLSFLLLTGISVGALAQALTTTLLIRADASQLRNTLGWLMGSLAYRDWSYITAIAPYSVLGVIATGIYSRRLDLLAIGDESAHNLGIRLESTRCILLTIASLLAASAVATCGIIGFVGLMVPNLMRIIAGPSHRLLIPLSILTGPILITLADVAARLLFRDQEIPIGIITSILGAGFFIYLLARQTRRAIP